MKSPSKHCNNCNSVIKGNYCNNCGQRASVNKVTFTETFHDFVESVFSINAPFINTLKLLFVNPGKLFREYLSGKRKAYYKPVSFFILATIVYVLILAMLNFNPIDKVFPEKPINVFNIFKEASILASKSINNLLFIYVFTNAVCLKIFFYKNYSLIEYIAVSFYLIAVYTLLMVITIPITIFTNLGYQVIPSILMFIYMIFSMISFLKKRNFATVTKIIISYFISLPLFWLTGFGISLVIVWLRTI